MGRDLAMPDARAVLATVVCVGVQVFNAAAVTP